MKNLLETYTNTLEQIFKNFGMEGGYGELDIRTNVKWNSDEKRGYDVRWIENECVYANELISPPIFYENYVLFYVNNGEGDKYYQIFDYNLKDEKIEE